MVKRSGTRVNYFNCLKSGKVVLLLAYVKSKFDSLRPKFLLKLKGAFDEEKET